MPHLPNSLFMRNTPEFFQEFCSLDDDEVFYFLSEFHHSYPFEEPDLYQERPHIFGSKFQLNKYLDEFLMKLLDDVCKIPVGRKHMLYMLSHVTTGINSLELIY